MPVRVRLAMLLSIMVSSGLSGCESLLPSDAHVRNSAKSEPVGFVTVLSSVSLGKVEGPPEDVSNRIVHLLDSLSRRASIALLNYETEHFDYRLQCVLRIEERGKLIYLNYSWWLFDRNGALVGRTSGTETFYPTAPDAGLWSQVPDSALRKISEEGLEAALNRR